jgi:hypothetical protein
MSYTGQERLHVVTAGSIHKNVCAEIPEINYRVY